MQIDLDQLARRESEQIEWKENVAEIDDVVATLAAFANDLQNLGGGYVICGAREDKDEHGFPRLMKTGLTAQRLKELEGTVLTRCRERVFGREPQRYIPGAVAFFSIYPGTDRSTPHAERHELAGPLVEQARRLQQLLEAQATTLFDKTDLKTPNVSKYPKAALYEAMGNARGRRGPRHLYPASQPAPHQAVAVEPSGVRVAGRDGGACGGISRSVIYRAVRRRG